MSNAFSFRKTTKADSDRKTAVGGFHKTLWNILQKQGYDASCAGTMGWSLIRAARPEMAHHATSHDQLCTLTIEQLGELRAAVRAAAGSEKTKSSPARAELAAVIMSTLALAVEKAKRRCPPMTNEGPEDVVAGAWAEVGNE